MNSSSPLVNVHLLNNEDSIWCFKEWFTLSIVMFYFFLYLSLGRSPHALAVFVVSVCKLVLVYSFGVFALVFGFVYAYEYPEWPCQLLVNFCFVFVIDALRKTQYQMEHVMPLVNPEDRISFGRLFARNVWKLIYFSILSVPRWFGSLVLDVYEKAVLL